MTPKTWYKIRRAYVGDEAAIAEIEKLCFSLPWSEDAFRRELEENVLAVYIVCECVSAPVRDCGSEPAMTKTAASAANSGSEASDEVASSMGPEIIAYAGIWNVADEAHIINVGVHPEHRRAGVGLMTVMKLLEAAEERGAQHFTLEVRASNEAAIKLYEKFGFRAEATRKSYYADGEDALIMWLHKPQCPV